MTLPNGWKQVRLGDLGNVVTGRTPPSAQPHLFGDVYPFITPSDMDAGVRRAVPERYVSEEGARFLSRINLPPNTPVFVCIGATIGKVALTETSSFTNQQINSIIVDREAHDPVFVYYLLLHAADRIKGLAGGAATPIINKSSFSEVEVCVPSLGVQRRIASILSAYDDLIENNTRRIAILEEMARRLYEEWFVQFRFPGREAVGDMARLPSAWECVTLGEVASYISRGISPKYDEEADCRVINQKCIRNQRLDMVPSRRQSKKVPEEKVVRFGDVLINSTGVGTLGRVAQVYEDLENVTVDSHVTIVRPGDALDIDFFGLSLLHLQSYFEDQGVGATGQTELSRARVIETELVLPPRELQVKFGELVKPMRSLCIRLAHKNANLRAQRDLLLPKLVSGEIDVSDIPLPSEEVSVA